jgi:hypothetical protein
MAVSHSRIGRLASRIAFDPLVTNLPVCSTIGLRLCELRIDSQPITEEICSVCRNIKTLFNFDPPVTDEEVRAASLQFVRKISGFNKPSKANEDSFSAAVDEVAGISRRLLRSLETTAPPKNREEEAAKAKARAAERFGA